MLKYVCARDVMYVCARDVMYVVFSVCIVRRGAVDTYLWEG